MGTRGFGLAIALSAVLGLAACGGEQAGDGVASAGGGGGGAQGASASPSQSLDPQEAQLKFAQCMRENGIDMPDPDGSGRVAVRGRPGDRGKLQAAMKECQHFMQEGGLGQRLNDPKVRDQLLKFARCMREHGIDMPDPQPGGGIQLRAPQGNREKLEAAQEACGELRPGAGGGGRTDGAAG